jgi:hypothetical protein
MSFVIKLSLEQFNSIYLRLSPRTNHEHHIQKARAKDNKTAPDFCTQQGTPHTKGHLLFPPKITQQTRDTGQLSYTHED